MFASGRGYCFKSYGHISDIENNSLNACIVKTIAFVLFGWLVGLKFNPTHTPNVYCENLILERSTWINDKLTLGYSKYR